MASAFPAVLSMLGVVVFSAPEQVLPITEGTAWEYKMTEEAGPGTRLSDDAQHQAGTLRLDVVYRIQGTREIDDRELLAFEMHRGGRIINTDLLTVDDQGIRCWARVDEAGEITKLDPPLPIVTSPLEVGVSWDFDSATEGAKVHQHYEVIGQDDITVPAGQFWAFHIRGEQTTPGPMTIDRWFVPGTGIIKDVTETRSGSGDLLRRISLELTRPPKVLERPDIKARPSTNKLTVSLGQEAVGESRNTFLSGAPKICARWQGRGLRTHDSIRVLWIAEKVEGVAPPDYTIDEATTTATAPDSHGVFTLGRPESGWATGVYRVEFYVDNVFADAAKIKIIESKAARFSPETGLSSGGLPPMPASPTPSRPSPPD